MIFAGAADGPGRPGVDPGRAGRERRRRGGDPGRPRAGPAAGRAVRHWLGALVRSTSARRTSIGGQIKDLVADGAVNTMVLTVTALLLAIVLALVVQHCSRSSSHNRGSTPLLSVGNTLAVALPDLRHRAAAGRCCSRWCCRCCPPAARRPTGSSPGRTSRCSTCCCPRSAWRSAGPRADPVPHGVAAHRAAAAVRHDRPRARHLAAPDRADPGAAQRAALGGHGAGHPVRRAARRRGPGGGDLRLARARRLLIEQGISGRDYPLVQVLLLLSVVVFVVIQLVTDVVHAWLDPRIRHRRAA